MAAVLTQPADVIKTKLMLRPTPGESRPSLLMVVRDIWEVEGIAGFFRGLIPRLLIVTTGGVVYFYVAEKVLLR